MQDTKNNTEFKDLANHLLTITVEDRKVWIEGMKKKMVNGDMKKIEELTGYKYYQIRQVFQGHTYNKEFAPEIIETGLNIIASRKRRKELLKDKVEVFFHDRFKG